MKLILDSWIIHFLNFMGYTVLINMQHVLSFSQSTSAGPLLVMYAQLQQKMDVHDYMMGPFFVICTIKGNFISPFD